MTKRRSRGDGGLHWDDQRQRWIASVTVGYTAAGKRIVKRGSGKTKTEAKDKLKQILRDYEDGLAIAPAGYTVADAVAYWLDNGLPKRDDSTVKMYRTYAAKHVIPCLGARKLRDLSVEDIDQWLLGKRGELGTRSLKLIHGILNRSMKNAMRRDKVKRNVVDLCEVPDGRDGRPSKALTMRQAEAVLKAAEAARPRMRAYIVVSLLSGMRTEEVRAMRWSHVVAYDQDGGRWHPVPEVGWDHESFAVYVWRSVRRKGDTKTPKSRRSLALPKRCVDALRALWDAQDGGQELVFSTGTGTAMTAHNVRRDFRKVLDSAGLTGAEWAPRELRHSFVSLLSDHDIPIEDISRLVGHSNTVVTETVYRHQIRPVIQEGATAMDRIFPAASDA
ncbi:site-specific integrase [Spongiactinospora sp. TRM90649]|uniref:site-specific integrase n=1 Tax=Spongiactinospora sp. TRM90649 TaxID=3031114 RepID=UPI0023F659A6|nr:site-specific integrase [Spongiactinospora sp. TRM90649]MDF5755430.1 site-specific integrase [Spongiactinospora sp. TRM90649]